MRSSSFLLLVLCLVHFGEAIRSSSSSSKKHKEDNSGVVGTLPLTTPLDDTLATRHLKKGKKDTTSTSSKTTSSKKSKKTKKCKKTSSTSSSIEDSDEDECEEQEDAIQCDDQGDGRTLLLNLIVTFEVEWNASVVDDCLEVDSMRALEIGQVALEEYNAVANCSAADIEILNVQYVGCNDTDVDTMERKQRKLQFGSTFTTLTFEYSYGCTNCGFDYQLADDTSGGRRRRRQLDNIMDENEDDLLDGSTCECREGYIFDFEWVELIEAQVVGPDVFGISSTLEQTPAQNPTCCQVYNTCVLGQGPSIPSPTFGRRDLLVPDYYDLLESQRQLDAPPACDDSCPDLGFCCEALDCPDDPNSGPLACQTCTVCCTGIELAPCCDQVDACYVNDVIISYLDPCRDPCPVQDVKNCTQTLCCASCDDACGGYFTTPDEGCSSAVDCCVGLEDFDVLLS